MKMKEKISAVAVAAGILLASAEVMGAEKICDDWEDGDPYDGEPYMWQTPSPPWPGTYEPAEGGGLKVVNLSKYHTALISTRTFSGDIKVHIRGNFSSVANNAKIAANLHVSGWSSSETFQDYFGSVNRNGQARITKWGPEKVWLDTAYIGFPIAEVDFDLEFLRCGNKLELRVWKSGGERPEEPQCSVLDASLNSGYAGISGDTTGAANPIIFRSICITPSPCECTECPGNLFIRGDANGKDGVDISDAVFILSYMFAEGDSPSCVDAADANDDGTVDISDAVSLLNHLFGDSEPLPEPFETCGADSEPADTLTCESYPPCKAE